MLMTGTPRREENFEERAHNFAAHAGKLASTAQTIAQSGGCNDRRTVEGIHAAAQQVRDHVLAICVLHVEKLLSSCT